MIGAPRDTEEVVVNTNGGPPFSPRDTEQVVLNTNDRVKILIRVCM